MIEDKKEFVDDCLNKIAESMKNPQSYDDIVFQISFLSISPIEILANNLLSVALWHNKKPQEVLNLFLELCEKFQIDPQNLLEEVKKVPLEQYARTSCLVSQLKEKLVWILVG